jgi:hypothetical protein
MPTNTSRLSLSQPLGPDPPLGLRTSIAGNATILDAAVRIFEGTLVARSGVTPAYGDEYYATDTLQWFKYNGSAWLTMSIGGRATVREPGPASDYSTTSTSYVVVDGTNLSATVQCSGAPVKVTFSGSAHAAFVTVIANAMDASVSGSGAAVIGTGLVWTPFCVVTVFSSPTAGSHTFAPYWTTTGTGSIIRSATFNSAGQLPTLVIEELGPAF